MASQMASASAAYPGFAASRLQLPISGKPEIGRRPGMTA
jgi:hypothetical protein